ncbi:MAG: UvrD-helicase domain-containing protein [Synergistaceae bacterium]
MIPDTADPLCTMYGNLEGLPEQLDAVTSLSPLTVVSAGAGTGKTQTLSQRFAWLLARDSDCRVDQILVLTFTEKAAREMHERIKKTLVEWYGRSEKDLPHLSKSIQRMDDAYISTIHSFAMKIIRESGLVLNIDPRASIVSKPEEELWWKTFAEIIGTLSLNRISRIVSEKWEERAEDLFNEKYFKDLVNFYGPEKLAEISRNASEKLGSFGNTPDDLWNQSMEELLSDVGSREGIFAEIWDTWQERVFPAIRNELREKPGKMFTRLSEIEYEYCGAMPDNEKYRTFASVLFDEVISDLRSCSKKIKASIEVALGVPLKDWRDENKRAAAMAMPPSERETELMRLLCRTSALGWQCWDTKRQREGFLTNNDLIKYAGEVLKKSPDYGNKFKHILVDEFQDTDGLQDLLIKGIWKEDVNTLFIVGDIKQSIYRFRHANLKIFQEYIDKARCPDGSCCKYITLDKSFRTRDKLVEKINSVFGSVWAEGIEKGSSMEYEPLSSPSSEKWWKERNNNPITPEFEILISMQKRSFDEEKKKYIREEMTFDSRVRLYRELAVNIKETHGAGKLIWDKKIDGGDKFRPVKWSDFALLVPKRTFYEAIEDAFESEDIPYVLCTRRDYFTRGEIADLVNLISLLAEPSDPSYLAGWVASPLSGMPPGLAEKLLARAKSGEESGDLLLLSDIISKEHPELISYLEEMRKKAELKGVSSVIRELLCSPEFLTSYEPEQRRRVRANISYMAEIAAEYEFSQGRSLAGCAEYMRFSVKESKQQEEPEITDEDHDAVNVLTIHSAKGLEYPVVALGGTEDKIKSPPSIDTSVRYGVVVKQMPDFLKDPAKKEELTVSGLWHDERETRALLEENERFWYVASTRARDKLIICGLTKTDDTNGEVPPADESFLGMIRNSQAAGDEWTLCSEDDPKHYHEPKKRADNGSAAAYRLYPKIVSPAKLARLSASAYAMLSWCPAAYRIAYRQGRTMQWTSRGGEGAGGAEFGSLAHWVLSRWDFSCDSLVKWLPENESEFEAILKNVPYEVRGEFKLSLSRKEIREMLFEYANSDEGEMLSALSSQNGDKKLWRETPFRVLDRDLLMVGSTDIFWEEDDRIRLRDWKTTAEDVAPTEYYKEQLKFYAYAMHIFRKEKGLPEKKIEIGINYLRSIPGKKKIIEMSDEMISSTGEKIHGAAVSALSDIFEARYEHCSRCPWRDICSKKHI